MPKQQQSSLRVRQLSQGMHQASCSPDRSVAVCVCVAEAGPANSSNKQCKVAMLSHKAGRQAPKVSAAGRARDHDLEFARL